MSRRKWLETDRVTEGKEESLKNKWRGRGRRRRYRRKRRARRNKREI